jgi:Na+/melibiose symporter-like transporter
MVEKAGFAVGPLIIGLLLSAGGYTGATTGAAAAPSAAGTLAIVFGVAYIPAIASALCVIALLGYNLTEKVLKSMQPPPPDRPSSC